MGYARTKLEEATERVTQLEKELACMTENFQVTNEAYVKVDRERDDLKRVIESFDSKACDVHLTTAVLEQERDALKAKLEALGSSEGGGMTANEWYQRFDGAVSMDVIKSTQDDSRAGMIEVSELDYVIRELQTANIHSNPALQFEHNENALNRLQALRNEHTS